jgi:hypothetical protein
MMCVICFEDVRNAPADYFGDGVHSVACLPCSHCYHDGCITGRSVEHGGGGMVAVLRMLTACPQCRLPFDEDEVEFKGSQCFSENDVADSETDDEEDAQYFMANQSFGGVFYGSDYLEFEKGVTVMSVRPPCGVDAVGWAFGEVLNTNRCGWYPPEFVTAFAE